MTTENHNQEMELDDLKVQYQSLQEKFNQQEIVNNDLIHEMIQTKIANFKRRNAEIILTYGLLAATVCWSCFRFELSLPFMIISIVLFALIGLFEWFSCQKVLKINTEDSSIQTLVQKMENIRTRFSLLWIIGVLALSLWMMWFIFEIGEKRTIPYLRSSFVMVAVILTIVIILIICNIDRLAKMSDELLAQTSRLNGNDSSTIPVYHRSGTYWSSIVMLVLSLIVLVFKLMHWPFANLICMAAGIAGLVFVILTARHLLRVAPNERLVIRMAEVACLFLVASVIFKIMHWPFGNLFGILAFTLLAVAFLVRLLKSRRGKRQ
ncbi:MAG: hypothetical protein IJQ94_05445 [Bacteroidales bacterium]|nr:hypothetical protein [Bacteroidales bacterium]